MTSLLTRIGVSDPFSGSSIYGGTEICLYSSRRAEALRSLTALVAGITIINFSIANRALRFGGDG